jgi:hypothetical protein
MDLVQTPRELFERELRVETEELARFPTEETDELAALYESRGLEPAGARQLAESVIAHRPLALDVMARTMRLDGANADEQPARDQASVIARLAMAWSADLVMVSGAGGVEPGLAQQIVESSSCPVLTVPGPASVGQASGSGRRSPVSRA